MKFDKPRLWLFYVIAIVAWLIQIGIVYGLSYKWTQGQKESHIEHELIIYENSIKAIELRHQALSELSYDSQINILSIQKIMHDAVYAKGPEQNRLRNQLHDTLNELYQVLQSNHIRQFQFHLPGSISFLRFHKPEQYGDSLKGLRKTVDIVNITHKKVFGFEEGRVNNGFRYLFPIFYKKEFVGTVEFGFSSAIIANEFKKLYSAHTELKLFKQYINATDFKDTLKTYKEASISNMFYADQEINHDSQFSQKLIDTINESIKEKAAPYLTKPFPFALESSVANSAYTVYFLPVHSYNGRHAGFIVVYGDGKELSLIDQHFWQMLWTGFVAVTIVTILLFSLYYRLRIYQLQLKKMAYTDKLTGIANRVSLHEDFKYLCRLARRLEYPMSIIFFDIDFFKKINDTYGHEAGDTILVELSRLIESRIRSTDIFGRWGGEEFIIALPDTSLEDAVQLAEDLRVSVEKNSFSYSHLTCSFGVAMLKPEETYENLINRADMKLYEAKGTGRNVVVY